MIETPLLTGLILGTILGVCVTTIAFRAVTLAPVPIEQPKETPHV